MSIVAADHCMGGGCFISTLHFSSLLVHRNRLPGEPEDVAVAVHPGLIDTDLARGWMTQGDVAGRLLRPVASAVLTPLMPYILLPLEHAVNTVMFAATAPASQVGLPLPSSSHGLRHVVFSGSYESAIWDWLPFCTLNRPYYPCLVLEQRPDAFGSRLSGFEACCWLRLDGEWDYNCRRRSSCLAGIGALVVSCCFISRTTAL